MTSAAQAGLNRSSANNGNAMYVHCEPKTDDSRAAKWRLKSAGHASRYPRCRPIPLTLMGVAPGREPVGE